MVVGIVIGAVFTVGLLLGAIIFIEDGGTLFLVVVCISSGYLLTSVSFYKDGQTNKTPGSLKGQCAANVQLTQYPGRDISGEVKKLRVLLYHNAKCSGQLSVKNG